MFATGPAIFCPIMAPAHTCGSGPVWTQRTINQSLAWACAAYGMDNTQTIPRLVAGGNSGSTPGTSYSDDYGVTWTNSASNAAPIWVAGCLAYGNGVWVGGGNGIQASRSTDGAKNWSTVTTSSFSKTGIWYAGYGSTFFCIGNSRTTLPYTTDGGATWNNPGLTLPSTTSSGATWGGTDGLGNHIICGAATQATMRSSNNGVTWVAGGNLPVDFATTGCVYGAAGGGTFVLLPGSSTVHKCAYSTDAGITWHTATLPTPPATTQYSALLFSQLRWLAFSTTDTSGNGTISLSPDGITWTTPSNQATWTALQFNPIGGVVTDNAGHYAIVPATAGNNTVIQTGVC